MKKIDKLIINAFVGPFILTFLVVVFILLTVQMMNYVDEIFGKDLEWVDLGKLIFHFSVFQTPIAFPLSVMLASLMAFGNLGEHFELTAIKSAGISLVRALMPIYIMVLMITVVAFYSNNYFVPHSALKAYSLLYDIRQKKPALDIQPGQFYAGIENYKIKVDKKLPDGKTLKGLIIYDHSSHKGNNEIIMADSGLMYTILNDQYLKFELFNGIHYAEGDLPSGRRRISSKQGVAIRPFTRTAFERSEIIFDLSSFSMTRTDEGLFASNRLMRNFSQLNEDLDSINNNIYAAESEIYGLPARYFTYSKMKKAVKIPMEVQIVIKRMDSLRNLEVKRERLSDIHIDDGWQAISVDPPPVYEINIIAPPVSPNKEIKKLIKKEQVENIYTSQNIVIKPQAKAKSGNKKKIAYDEMVAQEKKNKEFDNSKLESIDSTFTAVELDILERFYERTSLKANVSRSIKTAVATSRQIKSKLTAQNNRKERLLKEFYTFNIQWHKMLANAIACISMFLIGAPLGAIIKRGGLGFPVIISVLFFIIYYVISIGGEKYAKSGIVSVEVGVWAANAILFPIGFIFLRQAKNDARLFEADFYKVLMSRFSIWIKSFKIFNKSKAK